MQIRDFTKNDYQILVDLQNAIYPDIQAVVEDYINSDKMLDPKCKLKRWIAEEDGQPIGGGTGKMPGCMILKDFILWLGFFLNFKIKVLGRHSMILSLGL